MPAVVFDLDETLLDTSALRDAREARSWGEVARRLDAVKRYETPDSVLSVVDLPSRASEAGYRVGVLTHAPEWYAKQLLANFGVRYDHLISGSDSYPRKPDPTSLRAMASQLG